VVADGQVVGCKLDDLGGVILSLLALPLASIFQHFNETVTEPLPSTPLSAAANGIFAVDVDSIGGKPTLGDVIFVNGGGDLVGEGRVEKGGGERGVGVFLFFVHAVHVGEPGRHGVVPISATVRIYIFHVCRVNRVGSRVL
jgi:hypothetical protein